MSVSAKPNPPLRVLQPARPLVDEILGFCAPELAAHNVDMQVDDQAPGATIYADAKQLKQACLNLILNAIDAMPDGGRLTRPLRNLSEGVDTMVSGNYQHRVAVSGGDELAQLSSTFNHMTERLGELHHLEAQLRRRDRLHALGEVAMGLAHEIRNPLGIIKTATQLLHRRADLAETDKRHLEYVVSEVSRINELITEFLDFAKPNPPLRVLQPARPLVDEILGFCAPELAAHNVDVQVDDQAPGATIYADAKQLKQACLNLILNAIDAMPDGGRLTLGIRSIADNTVISIADTGQGIPAEMIERIFTPFVTTKASGTGLGLAKVYSIMESHDGSIECASEKDAGATFSLYIPAIGEDDEDSHDA